LLKIRDGRSLDNSYLVGSERHLHLNKRGKGAAIHNGCQRKKFIRIVIFNESCWSLVGEYAVTRHYPERETTLGTPGPSEAWLKEEINVL
jgi:hypothetical protein